MTLAADPAPAARRAPGATGPTDAAGTPAEVAAGFTRRHLLALLGITLLAAFLRLYRLGEWSFWVDEAHTFRDATSPIETFQQSHVMRYPLSFLLLRGLLDVLPSTGEGWLRLPFAFFGIASVPALAFVARGMVGRIAALIAALLLAISPWHIYWSQNCRSYAMVSFLSVLAMGAFFEATRRQSLLLALATVFLTVLAGLCHPSSYLMLGVFLVFSLSRLLTTGSAKADAVRTPLERWLPWLILLTVVAMVPLIVSGISYFARAKPDFSLAHLVQTTVYFVRAPLIVAALGGFLWQLHQGQRTAFFLLCWIAAPLAVLATGMFKVTAQYAFYTLPAFCLLAGSAVRGYVAHITASTNMARVMRTVPLLILAADALGYAVFYFTNQHGDRPNWRAVRDWIEREPGGDRLVLTTNGPSLCYYLDPEHMQPDQSRVVRQMVVWKQKVPELEVGDERGRLRPVREISLPEDPVGYLRYFMALAEAEDRRFYVVLTEPELDEMDPSGRFDRYLRTQFHQVLRLPVWTGPKDMEVLVYER
jgi:hypothetical protein